LFCVVFQIKGIHLGIKTNAGGVIYVYFDSSGFKGTKGLYS